MKQYAANKTYDKRAAAEQEAALSAKQQLPNSVLLARQEHAEEEPEDRIFSLESAMNEKISGIFGNLQPQIPTAEREADTLSAAVTAQDPEGVKAELGERLDADFSDVRFHTDTAALGYAEQIGARAYTSGRDVFFGEGGFDADVAAHELVHTVQQGGVESGTETVSTPAGGIQMLPQWMRSAGRVLKKPLVGANEFIGGKAGLVGAPSKEEKAENMARAQAGDMSMSARMSTKDKQAMTLEYKKKLAVELAANPAATPQEIAARYDTTRALNPFERRAMTSTVKDGAFPRAQAAKLKEAQELIDQRMMIDTMVGPSAEERENVFQHYKKYDDQVLLGREYDVASSGKQYLGTEGGPDAYDETQRMLRWRAANRERLTSEAQPLADADIRQAEGSGDALMDTMLLMQLGKFEKTTERKGKRKGLLRRHEKIKEKSEWDQTMANAFAHGGRTSFVFGAGTGDSSSDRITEQIFGPNAGLEERAAATHHLTMPKADAGTKGLSEGGGIRKGFLGSKMDRNFTHSGMNMAIGGIGKKGGAGPGGEGMMINVQGRNGHMYVGQAHSTADRKGGLLMGLESDSPYRMNQTGHMHNAAAKGEEGSSTGGLKTDITGKKYGGRSVDLSGLQNEQVAGLLQEFNTHVRGLRSSNRPEDKAELERLATVLSGKRLSNVELMQELEKFSKGGGIHPDDNLARIGLMVSQGRGGSDVPESAKKKKR